MRRSLIAMLTAGSMLALSPAAAATDSAGDTPVTAASPATQADGWEPAPSEPWDVEAGLRCDFAIHGEPVVDEVRKLVLQTYADGTPKRELYTGDLVVRITNVESGKSVDADAGGDAVMEYRSDGSMSRWYVHGPVLVGVGADAGDLSRGMWIVDGVFTIDFTPEGAKDITMAHGSQQNMCAAIS